MIRKLKISCWGTEISKLKKSFSCTFWTSYSRGLHTFSQEKFIKGHYEILSTKKYTETKAFTTFMDCDLQNQTDMPMLTLHIPKPISIKCCSPLHACLQLRAHYLICKKMNDSYSLHWNWHHYWLFKFSEEQSIIFTQDYLNMAFSSFMIFMLKQQ